MGTRAVGPAGELAFAACVNGFLTPLDLPFTRRDQISRHHEVEPHPPIMIDLLYLGLTVVFFILAGLYVHGCENL